MNNLIFTSWPHSGTHIILNMGQGGLHYPSFFFVWPCCSLFACTESIRKYIFQWNSNHPIEVVEWWFNAFSLSPVNENECNELCLVDGVAHLLASISRYSVRRLLLPECQKHHVYRAYCLTWRKIYYQASAPYFVRLRNNNARHCVRFWQWNEMSVGVCIRFRSFRFALSFSSSSSSSFVPSSLVNRRRRIIAHIYC